ncbi:phenylacetate--CoA ligase family protein [Paracraurococcus lichenis]|uniref:AMP-binding protein n=1 Tax=Paracraurococcus lichenis TaxID=3064888 RepID=A0ABT9DSX3_9PROT|nr:AMP-binding protein [Paracraurococcus sp. LOR1-02]MDO9706992.1 AMP-binding protein [Paracraurococcus sp. LOR1-02]
MALDRFYDALETRSADEREAALARALPGQVAHARARAPHYARALADVEPAAIASRAALAALPVARKSALIAQQSEDPPFGGVVATALGALARVFVSPGPIAEPEAAVPDYWRYARALHATGLRGGELLHNCFAYHFTPAGSMLEGGARALGCPVFPAGTGNTEMQARAAAQLRPRCYSGTPDFLKTILEKGDELGLDLSSLQLGHVTGGAYLPTLRAWYAERGLTVLQSYGTADLGLIAYESEAREGLILDEGVVVEILRPGTGDPLPDGEVGEVVVTTLNPHHPLLRFATGDLSAIMPGASPCGRTNRRIRGWMGRADQAAKVRGMFVRPEQVAEVLRAVPAVAKARLVVSLEGERDVMLLRAEATERDEALVEKLGLALQNATKLRGLVELVPPGTLPNDGKVIDDTRPVPG